MILQSLPVLKTPNAGQPPTKVRYINTLEQIPGISEADREIMRTVSERYVFRANDYYLKLINWADPNDPIKQLIIPRSEELNDWGKLDASNEAANTVEPGVQHKYGDTALLLCNEVCGAYCRYCFRKRLFMNDNEEVSKDISVGLAYIRQHPEISNVLLTGGDPLILGTRRLAEIIGALRQIDHVKIIRIGSKMPAFNPFRIIDDPELQALLRTHSTPEKRIYVMCHFDHPRELTDAARRGIATLLDCGVVCVNQCPIIKGINDHADTLAELFRELSYFGCPQYYCFQGRPTAGNEPFEVPLVDAWRAFSEAVVRESGLAGRARFCMSHASGKVEIQAIDDEHIYLRYHRSKYAQNNGRFFVCHRNNDAFWLDHLTPVTGSFVPHGVQFGQPTRTAQSRSSARSDTHQPPREIPETPQINRSAAFSAPCRGFTLIELLVTIAIIALLVGILMPALASARLTARATRELAAIKQAGVAWSAYNNEQRGKVMPGYLLDTWAQPSNPAFNVYATSQGADESQRLTGSTIRPYTWRLMPYVDGAHEALVVDAPLLQTLRDLSPGAGNQTDFRYAIARHPSFGMNTTYVGGDAHRGAFLAASTRRWGRFYVQRIDEVRDASRLLLFASARAVRRDSGGEKVPGYHRLDGPVQATPTFNSVPAFVPWTAPKQFHADLPTTTYGRLDFRFGGRASALMIDGHAEALNLAEINDMRRWSNQATSPEWRPR